MLALAGRRLTVRLRGPGLSRALGAVMVLTAVAMAFQLDIRFQTAIADHLPAALVNPTNSLETSDAVSERLAKLRPPSPYAQAPSGAAADLEDFGPAPDFAGNDRWFNSQAADARGAEGPRRADRLLDLHLHQLHPHAAAPGRLGQGLPRRGADDRRRPRARVQLREEGRPTSSARSKQNGIEYPVAQDNELATWNAWSNQYWPAKYLIDAEGHVRYAHFGEGDYDKTEAAIRALLVEAGAKPGATPRPIATYDPSAEATPETYLGAERAERFLPGIQQLGTATYTPYDGELPESHFSLGGPLEGRGRVRHRRARARRCAANVTGKDVYLVLSGPGTVDVTVDGKREKTVKVTTQQPLPPALAPDRRRARPAAALLARRRGLRVHVRRDPKGVDAGADGSRGRRRNGCCAASIVCMTSLAIETHGLGKRFGERAALESIDLEVPRGCAFGFLGRNGAGKTTLVRLLLGLAQPTSGTMRLLGHDLPG